MPREKYSPFLLVFRSFLMPLLLFTSSTVAPTSGWPCRSLQTPRLWHFAPVETESAFPSAEQRPLQLPIFLSSYFQPPQDSCFAPVSTAHILRLHPGVYFLNFFESHCPTTSCSRYRIGSAAPAC